MYPKTLFVTDKTATVGGLAGGLADLAALGAFGVEMEECRSSTLGLSRERLAELGAKKQSSLVAVGVSDPSALTRGEFPMIEALADRPLLYLSVNSPADEPLLPRPRRILTHVLVPSDFSERSACAMACLRRVVARGARVVTLMHVHDERIASQQPCPSVGELGRIDMEWVERAKCDLLRAGVDEVRLITPSANELGSFDLLEPRVSLVLAGGTCSAEVARAYGQAAMRLFAGGKSVPALMLSAEGGCSAGIRRGAA
jgi:nucleotide-binding universal stress UspA family protein